MFNYLWFSSIVDVSVDMIVNNDDQLTIRLPLEQIVPFTHSFQEADTPVIMSA